MQKTSSIYYTCFWGHALREPSGGNSANEQYQGIFFFIPCGKHQEDVPLAEI